LISALTERAIQTNLIARPQVLFFFMERFSNSRSWQSAMKLALYNEWFDDHNIVVILVGDIEHLLPATRLAAEMELPFLLLADHDGALWRRYSRPEFNTLQRRDAYVLVDLCGQVQYSVQENQFGPMLATDQLFTAIDRKQ
jgi:peroxiredoxin